jgi:hypothetical protein
LHRTVQAEWIVTCAGYASRDNRTYVVCYLITLVALQSSDFWLADAVEWYLTGGTFFILSS